MGTESVPETLEKFHILKQLCDQEDFTENITILKIYLRASYFDMLRMRSLFTTDTYGIHGKQPFSDQLLILGALKLSTLQ
jgi:hypothetical protein